MGSEGSTSETVSYDQLKDALSPRIVEAKISSKQQLSNSLLTALMTSAMLLAGNKLGIGEGDVPLPVPPAPAPSPLPTPPGPNPGPTPNPLPTPSPTPAPPVPAPLPVPWPVPSAFGQTMISAAQRDGMPKSAAVQRGAMLRSFGEAMSRDISSGAPRLTTVLGVARSFKDAMNLRGFTQSSAPNTTAVLIGELAKVPQGQLDATKNTQLIQTFTEAGNALMQYGSTP